MTPELVANRPLVTQPMPVANVLAHVMYLASVKPCCCRTGQRLSFPRLAMEGSQAMAEQTLKPVLRCLKLDLHSNVAAVWPHSVHALVHLYCYRSSCMGLLPGLRSCEGHTRISKLCIM